MKKLAILFLIIAALAASYWAGRSHPTGQASATPSEGKPLFYQSPMHPWVKSDKPGKCTICGMDLVPVYDLSKSFDAKEANLVMLPPGSPGVIGVTTEPVVKAPLTRTLRVAGTINDDSSRRRFLSAYVDGRIEKLYVAYDGAEVTTGQPLATFYSKELNSIISEYRLLARKPDSDPAGLKVAASRLRQYGLTDAQIERLPQQSDDVYTVEILAPMGGTVVKRIAYEGMYVKEGDPMFEIADFSTMWFIFDVYEHDIPWIQIGQTVTIRTPALPGNEFTAPITFINPNVDQLMRVAKVRAEVDNPLVETAGGNPRRLLLHQLYAEADVNVQSPAVLSVPRSAVIWPGGKPRVYVEKADGAYLRQEVKLGRPGDDRWEVLDGLADGQKVAVNAAVLLDSQAQLDGMAGAMGGELAQAQPKEAPPGSVHKDQAHGGDQVHTDHGSMGFFKAAAAATDALALDDLNGFKKALPAIPAPPPGLTLPALPQNPADLTAARLAFLPYSQALAAYVLEHQDHLGGDLRVFECPMTSVLGSGAPDNARWIQNAVSVVRNPYFGTEMLECGREVRP